MEIDAWDFDHEHYTGQGATLKAALRDARRQAMICLGISYPSLWLGGKRFPWPIVAHRECKLNALTVQHGEWRIGTDERRNM